MLFLNERYGRTLLPNTYTLNYIFTISYLPYKPLPPMLITNCIPSLSDLYLH